MLKNSIGKNGDAQLSKNILTPVYRHRSFLCHTLQEYMCDMEDEFCRGLLAFVACKYMHDEKHKHIVFVLWFVYLPLIIQTIIHAILTVCLSIS